MKFRAVHKACTLNISDSRSWTIFFSKIFACIKADNMHSYKRMYHVMIQDKGTTLVDF